jgi:hypothetical protein
MTDPSGSLPRPPDQVPPPVAPPPAPPQTPWTAPPPVAPTPPARRRPTATIAIVGIAVLALVAVGLALVLGGDEAPTSAAAGSAPAETASPQPSPEPSPTTTPSPTEEPSPSPDQGGPSTVSVDGVDLRLTSAIFKDRYATDSLAGTGTEVFFPGSPGDTFLIVRGRFEGNSDALHEFTTAVVDENGRRDTPSITTTRTGGAGLDTVEWVFAVSRASRGFTLRVQNETFDLAPFLA